jgi:hypothetical protein
VHKKIKSMFGKAVYENRARASRKMTMAAAQSSFAPQPYVLVNVEMQSRVAARARGVQALDFIPVVARRPTLADAARLKKIQRI